jgi:hypothetical protein
MAMHACQVAYTVIFSGFLRSLCLTIDFRQHYQANCGMWVISLSFMFSFFSFGNIFSRIGVIIFHSARQGLLSPTLTDCPL